MYVCVFSSVPCASASQPPKESYIQWLWCSKSIFKPLSGESEAHTTPETLSRVCSGASAATGYFDTTPRMATTVASAPVLRSCPTSQPAQVVSCYFNPSLPLSIHEVWHQASTQLKQVGQFVWPCQPTDPALTPCTLRDHHFPPFFFRCHGHQGPWKAFCKRWWSKFNGRCILDIQTMMD